MRVVLGQIDIVWENAPANLGLVARALSGLAVRPGSLVVLPEMFASGFSMDPARACMGAAESIRAVSSWARQTQSWWMAGLAVREPEGPTNAVLGFAPDGSEQFRFRKLHGFSPAGEPERYRRGDSVEILPVGPFRLAPFVCYDLRFPEVFREASRRGADLMVVVASWPVKREDHWITLLRARAIENQAWVIGVNRVGSDPAASYGGRSVVVDPTGSVRVDAGPGEGWMEAEIDPGEVAAWRRDFPALRDRRFA